MNNIEISVDTSNERSELLDTQIKSNNMEVLGVNVDIASILGDKLTDHVMSKITPDMWNKLTDHCLNEIFTKYDDEDGEKIFVKTKCNDSERSLNSYGYGTNTKQYLSEVLKIKVGNRLAENVVKKCEEIINSEEYQKRVDEIANELVDYATEGYKTDMKERIRSRLVNNVVDNYPSYGGVDLRGIIIDELHKNIHY